MEELLKAVQELHQTWMYTRHDSPMFSEKLSKVFEAMEDIEKARNTKHYILEVQDSVAGSKSKL